MVIVLVFLLLGKIPFEIFNPWKLFKSCLFCLISRYDVCDKVHGPLSVISAES